MYAVVGKSTIQDFDEARKFLREEGIPRLSAMPGFVSGHWVRLGENEGASMIGIPDRGGGAGRKERFLSSPPPSVTPVSVEVGEVQEHA